MISGRGALVDLAHDLKGAAQTLAHLRNGQAVVGLEREDGGITVVGGLGQVFGEGNAKELLDDVGDFSKYWPQNDGQHGARGSAPRLAGSNHSLPPRHSTKGQRPAESPAQLRR
jgi:hypothetical protein